jgi:hypothetical protein
MGRSSNLTRKIIADICAEAERNWPRPPEPRTCPFDAARPWYLRRTCSDCVGIVCARFKKFGQNDKGDPLPYLERPLCGAMTRQSCVCANRVVPGKMRCRFHGGLSTGPKTAEGKARIAAAQRLRWAKWRAAGIGA